MEIKYQKRGKVINKIKKKDIRIVVFLQKVRHSEAMTASELADSWAFEWG